MVPYRTVGRHIISQFGNRVNYEILKTTDVAIVCKPTQLSEESPDMAKTLIVGINSLAVGLSPTDLTQYLLEKML